MKALVLAAGKGERLWPLNVARPKALASVLCKPLLLWHTGILAESLGRRNVVVVVGDREEEVRRSLREAGFDDLVVVRQDQPLGTGHAVLEGLKKAGIDDGDVLVVYADVFIDPSTYRRALGSAISGRPALLAAAVRDASQFGRLEVSNSGTLRAIREKEETPVRGLVNAGVMVLPVKELLKELAGIKPSVRGELELTEALTGLASQVDINVLPLEEGLWVDAGTPWGLLEANRIALKHACEGKDECVYGERYLDTRGPVCVEGRVYVGGEVELGPFASLRGDNVLCGGNKVGFASEVKSSVFLKGARAPHLNYVGDSVVGENVNLGAGAITANLRHDEAPVKTVVRGKLTSTGMRKFGAVIGDESKIGINVSLLPGVKVGYAAWVGSACVVDQDVPDFAVVKCRQEVQISTRGSRERAPHGPQRA